MVLIVRAMVVVVVVVVEVGGGVVVVVGGVSPHQLCWMKSSLPELLATNCVG